jgi:hypothetical protein
MVSVKFELGYDTGVTKVAGVFVDVTGGWELPWELRLTLSMIKFRAATSGRAPKAPRLLLGGRTPIGKLFCMLAQVDWDAEVVLVVSLGISSIG